MSLQTYLAHAVLLSTSKNVQQMSKWAEKHASPRAHVGAGCAALLRPIGHASGSLQDLPVAWIWLPSSLPDERTQERDWPYCWLESSQAQSITQQVTFDKEMRLVWSLLVLWYV